MKMMQDFCDRTDRDFPVPVKEQPSPPRSPSGGTYTVFDLERFLAKHNITGEPSSYEGGVKYRLDACVFDSSHVNGEAAVFQEPNGKLKFHCFHDSCADYHWEDVREKLEPGYKALRDARRDNVVPMSSASAVALANGKVQSPASDFMLAHTFANMQVDELPQLVEGLIPAGGTVAIVAKPKCGKSTFALNLGFAVARGGPILDRATRQGPVLYVALEGSESEWRRLLRAMGVAPEDEFFFYHGRRPEDVGPWLREAVAKYRPVLIIFDTLQRLVRVKDMSDYAALSNGTDELIELARTSQATLAYLHHGGKSEKADPVDSPLGSTAIAGSVDTLIYMKRGTAHRTIQTVQRSGEDMPETVLEMDPRTFLVTASGYATGGKPQGPTRDEPLEAL